MGIEVLPPDVNESQVYFAPSPGVARRLPRERLRGESERKWDSQERTAHLPPTIKLRLNTWHNLFVLVWLQSRAWAKLRSKRFSSRANDGGKFRVSLRYVRAGGQPHDQSQGA